MPRQQSPNKTKKAIIDKVLHKNILICPNCKSPLFKVGNSLKCQHNHSFDLAKEGYVNLLLPNEKKTKDPGDDAVMVSSREAFLKKGYYEKLQTEILEIVKKLNCNTILDAGCGTGYYINLAEYQNLDVIGIDISKHAIKKAAKEKGAASFLVASIFNLPFQDETIDAVINIFAPKPEKEFLRVLKDGGVVIEVTPGENHLIELKKAIYSDQTRKNQEKTSFSELALIDFQRLTYQSKVKENDDLTQLVMMTPYWYKGGEKNLNALKECNIDNITFDFIIKLWKKQ